MCGITGIISSEIFNGDLSYEIREITEVLRHRGPDGGGCVLFYNPSVRSHVVSNYKNAETIEELNTNKAGNYPFLGLGHRRLAVLDTSEQGFQPMSYFNRYWITFNGEIYNYLELRTELQNINYKFHSNTDTEVILAAYDAWGSGCLSKFNGMWAFCIYDKDNDTIFIARDRYGVKPLYYYLDSEIFAFASEAKALLRCSKVKTKPNIKNLKEYIESGFKAFVSETAFENIYTVPSSSFIEMKRTRLHKGLRIQKYYTLPTKIRNYSFNHFIEKYNTLLLDSVRIRLRSDITIGTCLSGGLDSSSIACLVNKLLEENGTEDKQKTFSLVFPSKSEFHYLDESKFIELLTEHLNLEGHKIEPTIQDVISIYDSTVYHLDFPQDSSMMSAVFTYRVCKENGCQVTLDGQGSDEIQAGYLHYLRNYFCNLPVFQIIENYILFKNIPGAKSQILLGICFKIFSLLMLRKWIRLLLRKLKKHSDPFITVNEHLFEDLNNNLQNLLLVGDRTSMMHSVESRFPFLDYRVVELLFSQPEKNKLFSGWTKYSLRSLMKDLLPHEIIWRRDKIGWAIPEKHWFCNEMKDRVKTEIKNSTFLRSLKLDLSIVDRLEDSDISFKKLKKIIRYYNIAVWHRIFFSQSKASSKDC